MGYVNKKKAWQVFKLFTNQAYIGHDISFDKNQVRFKLVQLYTTTFNSLEILRAAHITLGDDKTIIQPQELPTQQIS